MKALAMKGRLILVVALLVCGVCSRPSDGDDPSLKGIDDVSSSTGAEFQPKDCTHQVGEKLLLCLQEAVDRLNKQVFFQQDHLLLLDQRLLGVQVVVVTAIVCAFAATCVGCHLYRKRGQSIREGESHGYAQLHPTHVFVPAGPTRRHLPLAEANAHTAVVEMETISGQSNDASQATHQISDQSSQTQSSAQIQYSAQIQPHFQAPADPYSPDNPYAAYLQTTPHHIMPHPVRPYAPPHDPYAPYLVGQHPSTNERQQLRYGQTQPQSNSHARPSSSPHHSHPMPFGA
eukprot:TRINITY_DN7257_c0_g1_i2.p1 TRINITY_DN7257_c0_g1~~TRINITY_DN7257_c0_g1_i2.p1  ORF type:complete len:288 (-),score=34.36 TRINITY_DN7257_c0_g1_i2:107-970(-)